jgi:hypothetical protein
MRRIVIVILIVVGLAGCAREPEMADLVKYMLVQTDYDLEEINEDENIFNDYATFVLRQDALGFVSTYTSDSILLDEPGTRIDFVNALIEKVGTHATERGFERVEDNENPDFAIKIVVLENFSSFQTVSYPGYYSGYYGYYGGYYGPIVSTYSSNFVTLVIEVVDIKNYAANGNKYKVVWSAYIGDLLTTYDRKNKILYAVDQAFEQSPYFSKN